MKEFLLVNMTVYGSRVMEMLFDSVVKELPFHSKQSITGHQYIYRFILIEKLTENPFGNLVYNIENFSQTELDELTLASIYSVLSKDNILDTPNFKMNVDVIQTIKVDDLGIVYSDGSFRKADNRASYGICRLDNISQSPIALKDSFTELNYEHTEFSGNLEGTNNVGELTGISKAIDILDEKQFQVIISDSEYSIKSFREWSHGWKKNNWRNSTKKEIMNKELIVDTYNKIHNLDKILLFKWTRGHNNDIFNEICDELAKNELDIVK